MDILPFMPPLAATLVMDQLIAKLSAAPGPYEHVMDECFGGGVQGSNQHPSTFRAIRDKTDAIIQELRKSWGPTADPHWVEGIIPGRGQNSNETEFDCLFALFHKPGIWGYVRLRAHEDQSGETEQLKLVLGVVRDDRESLQLTPGEP